MESASGLLVGHSACAAYLEQTVESLLLHPTQLDQAAQQALLATAPESSYKAGSI